MPRIGNDTAGGARLDITVGHKIANKYLLPLGAYIESITVDCDGLGSYPATVGCYIAGGIYADNDGSPGALLAKTSAVLVTHNGVGSGDARAWVTLPIASLSPADDGLGVRIEDAGDYWIAVTVVSGQDDCVGFWAAGAGVGGAANDKGLIDPFGAFTVPNTILASYATVEFDAPPAPPPPSPPPGTAALDLYRDAVDDELGDVSEMLEDESLLRWINRGRRALGIYKPTTAALTWNAGDSSVALPEDFGRFEFILADPGSTIPQYVQLATTLSFLSPTSVSGGSATLYYGSRYPDVDNNDVSTMPPEADEAVVSFILARFFGRLASSRADFKRYSTITGQNGLELQDFLNLSDEHQRDFEARRDALLVEGAVSFYAD